MAPTQKPYDIAIVGGGIAGLVLAIGLLKHSIPITVYESAPQFGEIGAGVGLGPNAVRAMELIDPKIKEGYERGATQNGWASNEKVWFTLRVGDAEKADGEGVVGKTEEGARAKVGQSLFTMPYAESNPLGGVHRAQFIDEMVKLVPDHVCKFHKRCTDIHDAEDGSGDVVLTFKDGSTARHSAVIGCDGIKSRTRHIMLGENHEAASPIFTGKYAYRGLIPMDRAIELIGEEKATNSQMYLGYHGHVLTFPVSKGKTMNVVAFSSRDSWDKDKWVVETTKEEMQSDFSHWGSTVKTIIDAMEDHDIWALFDDPPAPTYFKNRICLIGDAAHASTPHQGAGAGMAIEDVYVLSALVAEAKSASDLEKVFRAYDEVRRPRTQKLVTTSREAGRVYEFEAFGDVLAKIEENLSKRMSWIWDEDLPQEVEEGKGIIQRLKAEN